MNREGSDGSLSGARKPLPDLLDNARLRAELGVTKAAAGRIMRAVPNVEFEGLRKVYVKRSDVARLIESRTFEDQPCEGRGAAADL